MKKSIFLIFIFIGTFCHSNAQLKLGDWTDAHYKKYKYESFLNLKVVNQAIDAANFDKELFCAALFYCANKERVKHKRERLIYSAAIQNCAEKHSEEWMKLKYFTQLSIDKVYGLLRNRLKHVGLKGQSVELPYSSCLPCLGDRAETYKESASQIIKGWKTAYGKNYVIDKECSYAACGVHQYSRVDCPEELKIKMFFVMTYSL